MVSLVITLFVFNLIRHRGSMERLASERASAVLKMDQILSAISEILVTVDRQGRVSRWNSAAATHFGREDREVLGRELADLPLPLDWSAVARLMDRCRGELRPVKAGDIWYEQPDGKDGFLLISLTPVLRRNGDLDGMLLIGTDITEYKVMEAQLSQAQKLEAIGQLSAGLAHEINTPTQYVSNTITFLHGAFEDLTQLLDLVAGLAGPGGEECQAGAADRVRRVFQEIDYPFLREEMPKSLARAQEGIGRVSSIVQAMRLFSHPGEKEKRAVDLNAAVENTAIVSRNEWKYVAELTTDLDPALPKVVCLPGEMNQVLLNLVINAAHAVADVIRGGAGLGSIRVSTALEGDRAHISVADSGTGIPAAVQAKIFDPFFTTKEVGKGTGQGLTLAYDVVVRMHGGSLTFETEEGRGTVFHLRLPLDGSSGGQARA